MSVFKQPLQEGGVFAEKALACLVLLNQVSAALHLVYNLLYDRGNGSRPFYTGPGI